MEFARRLRREATREERVVWEVLRDRRFMGLKFRRQHVIEGFVVDFYCHEMRLAVEIDGKIHEKQKEYDERRQGIIEDTGIRFVRVKNEEIWEDINIMLDRISAEKKRNLKG